MPSFAAKILLVLAAATQPDSLSPPPLGGNPGSPVHPTAQSPRPAKTPSVKSPLNPKAPRSPRAPGPPVTARPALPAAPTDKAGTFVPKIERVPQHIVAQEEEIVAEPPGKTRSRRRSPRSVANVDRPETQERRAPWSADRYAAVVPPGLTLAALRNQLANAAPPTTEPNAPSADHDRPTQTLSDIEKAREALRQETARLEALLRATGNCGGGTGMTNGEPLLPRTQVSASDLREAASEQIDSVSKAIRGMKPDQAAALIARLDRGLAAEILRRMKSSDAGAILGLLKPDLAAELATVIATHKPAYPREKKGSGR